MVLLINQTFQDLNLHQVLVRDLEHHQVLVQDLDLELHSQRDPDQVREVNYLQAALKIKFRKKINSMNPSLAKP